MSEITPPLLQNHAPKLSIWKQIIAMCRNPISTLSDKTKDSPLITILAIVFVFQPVITSSVGLVKDMIAVKQSFDPATRPITRGELEIVNEKIDFLQKLIVANMKEAATAPVPTPAATAPSKPVSVDRTPKNVVPYVELQKKLSVVQSQLDVDYRNHAKK